MPKVLVVEDNPPSLRFFIDALAAFGIESVGAENAAQALAAAAGIAFDLLLVDANLPDLAGSAVLAAIRDGAGPSHASPAIATTAAPAEACDGLLAAGFHSVIGKPVRIEVLRAALAVHVELPTQNHLLDDARASSAAGGDPAIVDALRGLFAAELDALPGELAGFAARRDCDGLRARLHRLAASAGFCGADVLATAVTGLHRVLDDAGTDLDAALAELLVCCRATRAALAGVSAVRPPAPMR